MYQRSRSRGGFQLQNTFGPSSIWTNCSQSSWTTPADQPAFSNGDASWIFDTSVPGYAQRVANGEVFFNPLLIGSETRTSTLGSAAHVAKTGTPSFYCSSQPKYYAWKYNDPAGWHKLCVETFEGPTAASAMQLTQPNAPAFRYEFTLQDISDFQAEVATSVLAKRGTTASNQWETLAEIKQTLGLLRSTLKSIADLAFGFKGRRDALLLKQKYLQEARKGARLDRSKMGPREIQKDLQNYQRANRQITREIANLWAQARWAYRPLFKAIGDILKGLGEIETRRRETTRASLKPESRYSVETKRLDNWSSAYFDFRRTSQETVEVRAMSLDELLVSKLAAIGFTTKGLLAVPWELITLSFVADWIANIGDFLASMIPTPGLDQLGSCCTIRRTSSNLFEPVATVGKTGYTTQSPFTGAYMVEREEFRRINGPFAPRLMIREDFRLDDIYRCMDLVTLIRQRLTPKL